ncbi:NAD-dependent epimerase/dehydratase family protein [Microbacterium album]|uniref:Epimerase n=1 Tax=Microbacterium album TaxID=2053191 RepID=A0A917IH61_9MICO|nr:NAD-dependent epimerase/dehydratase family protein [Microbacterium album]GGH49010.1 epimerase [Microbacterium album]
MRDDASGGRGMTSLAGVRVVVTGGAGFIGGHLVDELVARRHVAHVTVVDSLVSGRRSNIARWTGDPRVRLVRADIRSGAAVRPLAGADVVFHLAGLGAAHGRRDPIGNHDVNATATLMLLERARAARVGRFVHVSSSAVIGTPRRVPIGEKHPTLPDTVHGAAKLAGEAYARAAHRTHGLEVVVVRPFDTYGPRCRLDGDDPLPRAVIRNLCGLPSRISGDGRQTRDLMHVSDAVRALATIAECDEAVGRTINIGSGEEITVTALAEVVARAVGRPDLEPVRLAGCASGTRRSRVDVRLLRKLTGFTPALTLEDGLLDLVRWVRGQATAPEQLLARAGDRAEEIPDDLTGRPCPPHALSACPGEGGA